MIFQGSQNQTNFLPSPCPNNLASLYLLFQNCAQTKYTKPGGNDSFKRRVKVALVFPRLFPFLVNCRITLGESRKKQVGEWKLEQRCGLWTESPQKGVSERGWECQRRRTPNSFVMDVFILKTKLPFNAAIAGLGRADGRRSALGEDGVDVKAPCLSAPWCVSATVYIKGDL